MTVSNESQMSGSQMMKNKEDVAAIMKAKQQAGEYTCNEEYRNTSQGLISNQPMKRRHRRLRRR